MIIKILEGLLSLVFQDYPIAACYGLFYSFSWNTWWLSKVYYWIDGSPIWFSMAVLMFLTDITGWKGIPSSCLEGVLMGKQWLTWSLFTCLGILKKKEKKTLQRNLGLLWTVFSNLVQRGPEKKLMPLLKLVCPAFCLTWKEWDVCPHLFLPSFTPKQLPILPGQLDISP